MSYQAMTWAIRQKAGGGTRKIVLLCLANYADSEGACFPSHSKVAEEAELSERTVWTIINELEEKNLLARKERRREDGTRTTDLIVLPIQPAEFAVREAIKPQSVPRATRKDCGAEPITEPITKDARPRAKKDSLEIKRVLVTNQSAQWPTVKARFLREFAKPLNVNEYYAPEEWVA